VTEFDKVSPVLASDVEGAKKKKINKIAKRYHLFLYFCYFEFENFMKDQ